MNGKRLSEKTRQKNGKWTVGDLKAALLSVSKLASERAEFFNPLHVMDAKRIRDYVLSHRDEFSG